MSGLPADAVLAVEDARTLLGLDVARLVLVGRLGRVPVTMAVDAEVVVPVMVAARRRLAVERIRVCPSPQRRRFGLAAAFAEAHLGAAFPARKYPNSW